MAAEAKSGSEQALAEDEAQTLQAALAAAGGAEAGGAEVGGAEAGGPENEAYADPSNADTGQEDAETEVEAGPGGSGRSEGSKSQDLSAVPATTRNGAPIAEPVVLLAAPTAEPAAEQSLVAQPEGVKGTTGKPASLAPAPSSITIPVPLPTPKPSGCCSIA